MRTDRRHPCRFACPHSFEAPLALALSIRGLCLTLGSVVGPTCRSCSTFGLPLSLVSLCLSVPVTMLKSMRDARNLQEILHASSVRFFKTEEAQVHDCASENRVILSTFFPDSM